MSVDSLENAAPEEAAAYWFTRQRANGMNAAETRALEVWLERDARHQAAFKRVQNTWSVLGDIEDDPGFIDLCGQDERLVDSAKHRRAFASIAASVAVIAAGGWVLTHEDTLSRFGLFAPPPAQEFRTAVGERKNVTLADGSVLTLDTDTVLHTRLSHGERLIELDRGQASFKVAKDKYRPFIVVAGDKAVRATGTVFDVRLEPGRFEVTLIEGRVRVQEKGARSDDGPVADMRQGWKLAVGEDARWRMEPVDLVRATSWHDGMLMFQRDTLEQAVAEMNRYSARKIVFKGEAPKTVVLGMFHAGDVNGFVRAIEINKLARVTSRTEDSVELAAR